MVTWSRLGYRPPPPPTTLTPRPGPAAQMMPPPLVGGIVRPGMGPPGRGPLRPPRSACSPRKLCANREVSIRTPEGRMERLKLRAEAQKAFAPTQGGKAGASEDLPHPQRRTNSLALAYDLSQLRWMFTGTQPESASPLFTPDCTCFSHLIFGEDTSNCGHAHRGHSQLHLLPVEPEARPALARGWP